MRLEKLYAILDPSMRPELPILEIAEALIAGGARFIQLRNKNTTSRELLAQAVELERLCRQRKTRLIINDRADVAWLSRAQGVHLGQHDLSVKQARKILGPKKIVGLSTHNGEQAREANKTTATYVAVGPIFPTKTKTNPDAVVGLTGLREIRERVSKPMVAIGGITAENAREVLDAGADSVAVISDLLSAPDIAERTRIFLEGLKS